tara:strand:- start:342 stop:1484 length:1143 start_codon:yes stop_codon:yes gene_type:complete
MLTRKQVLMVKVESTEGVNANPAPETDALLILEGGGVTPEGQVVGSARLSSTLSREPDKIGQFLLGLTAPCEFRGNGIVGNAVNKPDFDAVLRACAMKRTDIEFIQADGFAGTFERGETVTGGTSGATGQFVGKGKDGIIVEGVVGTFSLGEVLTGATSAASANATDDPISGHQYMPTSVHADKPSVTAIRYQDGHKFSLVGGRADYSITLPSGEKGTIEFTIRGSWEEVVQESNPTPTLNDAEAPLVESMNLEVAGYAPLGVTNLALSGANSLSKLPDMNASEGLRGMGVTGRQPAGSFDPEAVELSQYNPWSEWKAGTLGEISFQLGSAPGNRIFVCMPKVQRTSVAYGDREGTVVYDEAFELKRDVVGDDELRLVFF